MECSDFMQQLRSFKPQSLGSIVARRKSSTTLIFPLPPQACSGKRIFLWFTILRLATLTLVTEGKVETKEDFVFVWLNFLPFLVVHKVKQSRFGIFFHQNNSREKSFIHFKLMSENNFPILLFSVGFVWMTGSFKISSIINFVWGHSLNNFTATVSRIEFFFLLIFTHNTQNWNWMKFFFNTYHRLRIKYSLDQLLLFFTYPHIHIDETRPEKKKFIEGNTNYSHFRYVQPFVEYLISLRSTNALEHTKLREIWALCRLQCSVHIA